MVRELVDPEEFVEIFVDTPLEECIRRDPKGLYARAREGKIKNFTGIDSPYEVPQNAEIVVDTREDTADGAARKIMASLTQRRIIP
jgi:bifunctional enzyme CysN/CysC